MTSAFAEKLLDDTTNAKLSEMVEEHAVFADFIVDRKWPTVIGQKDQCVISPSIAINEGQTALCTTTIIEPQEANDKFDSQIDSPRRKVEEPVFYHELKPERRSYFFCMQKWRGVVFSTAEETFWAKLEDLDIQKPDEEAEILLSEISDEDKPLIKLGAVFYWSIGYHTDPSRQRRRASIIRFRRLPMWTAGELKIAKSKAADYKRFLGADDS